MLSVEKTQNDALAASIVDWWKMAGVDYVIADAPVDWLSDKEIETSVVVKPAVPTTDAQDNAKHGLQASHMPSPVLQANEAEWPIDLEALHQAIMRGNALPGNNYGGKSVLPVGPLNAHLMIIGDLPDNDEIAAGHFGAGAQGLLLANMLKVIGLDLSACYLTALASTRPATGELADEDLTVLGAFALHHISLVNPDKILILGSAACRALIGKDLLEARAILPDVNHIVGKKAAISTFHPRTLLARSMLKAQAWKDLQMLAKKDAL
jgi:uracil-DNA glycosylase